MKDLKSRREAFVESARAQLGYRARAFNDSEFATQAGYPGLPWDGSFLEVARKSARLGGPVLANTTAALAWFTQHSSLYRKPRKGDVVFFGYSTFTHFSQPHVGVVSDVSEFRKNGFFRVIEGQTDAGLRRTSTTEDSVHERTRHTDDVIGFGRLPILDVDAINKNNKNINNIIHARMLQSGKFPGAVVSVQLALGDTIGLTNARRGVYDATTSAAFGRWQREVGIYGEHGKPDDRALRILGERTGRFHVE